MKNKESIHKRNYESIIKILTSGDQVLDSFIHLTSVGDMMHRYFENELSKIGLNRAQYAILYQLKVGFVELSPTIISRRMPRAQHTITKAISALEDRGFVKRTINPKNRRSFNIKLTSQGSRKADEAIQYASQLSHKMMGCLQEEKLIDLDQSLLELRSAYLIRRNKLQQDD